MKFEELFQPKPGSVAAEMQKTIDGLNKEIKELLAENTALQADKERLDWLTNTGCWLTFPVLSKNQNWRHGTSRAVIDAARKEAQP